MKHQTNIQRQHRRQSELPSTWAHATLAAAIRAADRDPAEFRRESQKVARLLQRGELSDPSVDASKVVSWLDIKCRGVSASAIAEWVHDLPVERWNRLCNSCGVSASMAVWAEVVGTYRGRIAQ